MNDKEFMNWIWNDLFQQVSKGLLIYLIFLGSYWLTIG